MAKITGVRAHTARLRRMRGPEATRKIGAALFAGASAVAVEAQLSITNGAVSGKGHVPSAPGEPPNQDTGVLANNIEISGSGAGSSVLKAEVSANAPYAAALEFGTSKMAERPYMRPAVAKTRKEVTRQIRKAMNEVNRASKSTGKA